MLDAYMCNTAIWAKRIGVDDYAEPIFSYSSISCRINDSMKYIKSSKGEQIVSDQILFTSADIGIADRISTDGGSTYRQVLNVSTMDDIDGIAVCKKVYL